MSGECCLTDDALPALSLSILILIHLWKSHTPIFHYWVLIIKAGKQDIPLTYVWCTNKHEAEAPVRVAHAQATVWGRKIDEANPLS